MRAVLRVVRTHRRGEKFLGFNENCSRLQERETALHPPRETKNHHRTHKEVKPINNIINVTTEMY